MGYESTAKPCSKCRNIQLLTNFHRSSRAKDGRQGVCRSCRKTLDVSRNNEPAVGCRKQCSSCASVLPIEDFGVNRQNSDGRNGQCRGCKAAYNATREFSPRSDGTKICCVCVANLPRTRFHKHKRNTDGRASICVECQSHKDAAKVFPAATSGEKKCASCGIDKHVSEFYVQKKSVDGRQSMCILCQNDHIRNYDQTDAGRKSRLRRSHARRSRKSAALGSYTSAQLDVIYNKHESCVYCETRLDHDEKTIDHVVPLAGGGSNFAQNLVVACGSCNSSKCDSDPVAWCESRFGYVPEAVQNALEFHWMITHPDELVLAA